MKRLLAALSFFTRLPFWRLASLSKRHYSRVVPFWPLTGWLTAAVMTAVFWAASLAFPAWVAVSLSIVARLLITGAIHEDGLADFFDGFGGGHDRQSTLRIMKDSHIGTYGVIALIIYFLLTVEAVCAMTHKPYGILLIFLCADPFAKWVASNIINVLPYARSSEEAKNKLVYETMTLNERLVGFVAGVTPSLVVALFIEKSWIIVIPMAAATITGACIMWMCNKRLKAYTGDCCGACFLISELVFFLAAAGVVCANA